MSTAASEIAEEKGVAAPVSEVVATETRGLRGEVDGKRGACWSWWQSSKGKGRTVASVHRHL